MSKRLVFIVIVFVLVGGLLYTQKRTLAQTLAPTPPVKVNRTGSDGPNISSPSNLSSKVLSNPYCYQPDTNVNQCYINLRYYQAVDNGTTAPYLNRVIIATSIDGITYTVRYNSNAFFESTINYSYDMVPGGFKVPYGAPNASGKGSQYGLAYYVKVTPLDTNDSEMGWDQAYLYCPAYTH